ncbi:MAG TPA: TonB-dependent receptor [Candidatus Angelobacter sp.]
MRRLFVYCSILLMCLSLASLAFGQSAASATIVGTVTDTQGAVVPNATVTATNTATGVSHSAKTTSSGNYTIPNLQPGSYNVKAEAASFAPAEYKDVKLNVGDQRDVNVSLGAAGKAEVVEVTAEAPLIETTKTDVSTAVTDLDMERLPAFAGGGGVANDYAQLALTAPGVKMDTSSLTGDLIAPGSINNRANLYNVDGANITDQLVSGRDGLGASVDEIQEFQVLTNNYNAEYGQAGGLIINAVTKSGTNGVHGDGHMYFRGRNLTAAQPLYNLGLSSSAIPAGTVGPPGTPHCPASDFDALGNLTSVDGCDRAPFHRKEGGFTIGGPFIKDHLFWFGSYELTRQAFPLILTPDTGTIALQSPTNDLLYSGKIDYKISNNHLLTARYNVERTLLDNLIVQTSNSVTPDDLTSSQTHEAGANVGLVSSLTPTLVNEARFSYFRFITSTPDKTTVPGVIHADGTISGANFCCPQGGLQKRYQYIDNLTWTHGAHTFKMGANISYYPWNSLFPQFHFGQYTTDKTGKPTSFTFAIGPGEVTSKDNIYGGYFQDTWKIGKKLTVNAGIRYDLEAGAFKGGKIHGPDGTCFQGNGIIPACSSDYNNWQPRLGFTFAPWQGTLFKASFAEVTMLAFNNVVLDSLNFDGTTLNTITTTDPAVLAAFPSAPNPALLTGGVTCPPKCGRVRPISDNLHNPEIRMFNFGMQHEFSRTLSAEVQYIGQFGFGLFGERDRNAPPVIADAAHPGFFFFGSRPDSRFLAIRTNENSRTSHYNGLLVSATKRFSNHIQFNASYTWSHALTSGEDFFGLSEPGDYVNIRPELGPAFNDIRHAANFGVVLDSGKLTTTNVVRWFTNDLGLSFVGQLQSGRPYPFSTGSSGFGASGRFFGTGSETQQRPVVLPDGTISTAGIASFDQANALFGPTAVTACIAAGFPAAQCASIQNTFAAPVTSSGAKDALTGAPVDFRFINGNLGRDAGRGAPFYRLDTSLKKTFRVPHTERMSVELRGDAFNVLNHANWQGFNANNITALLGFGSLNPLALAGPTGNIFNCTICQRPNGTLVGGNGQLLNVSNIQSGKFDSSLAFPNWGAAPDAGIGDPASTDIPRTFQLSFHVRF